MTEITKVLNRGHSLTIDSGWRDVADTALRFVQRFTQRVSCRYSRVTR